MIFSNSLSIDHAVHAMYIIMCFFNVTSAILLLINIVKDNAKSWYIYLMLVIISLIQVIMFRRSTMDPKNTGKRRMLKYGLFLVEVANAIVGVNYAYFNYNIVGMTLCTICIHMVLKVWGLGVNIYYLDKE